MVAGYWILSTVGLHASDSSATFCILLMQRGNLSSDFFEWTQRWTVVPFRRDSVLNLRDRTDGKELLNSPMSKTAQKVFFEFWRFCWDLLGTLAFGLRKDQSQVYLPINNALSEVGHWFAFHMSFFCHWNLPWEMLWIRVFWLGLCWTTLG